MTPDQNPGFTYTRITRGGQVRIYFGKWFRIFLHDKGYLSLLSAGIIAAIVAWVTNTKAFEEFVYTRSAAFALVCACIWIGIFNSIQSICKERGVIKREHRTGLHISSYVVSHALFDLSICFLEALVVTIIFVSWRGAPTNSLFFDSRPELFIVFFLTILCADMLGMLISALVRNETQAMTIMPFVLIIQMVMCNILFELKGFAAKLANLTISKWAATAICVISDVRSMPDAQPPQQIPGAPPVSPQLYQEARAYSYTKIHLLQCIGILALFIVAYLALSVVLLEFIDHDAR